MDVASRKATREVLHYCSNIALPSLRRSALVALSKRSMHKFLLNRIFFQIVPRIFGEILILPYTL